MKKISQVEARRLRKRVADLETALKGQGFVKLLGSVDLNNRSWFAGRLEGARELNHPLVATVNDAGRIYISAVRLVLP